MSLRTTVLGCTVIFLSFLATALAPATAEAPVEKAPAAEPAVVSAPAEPVQMDLRLERGSDGEWALVAAGAAILPAPAAMLALRSAVDDRLMDLRILTLDAREPFEERFRLAPDALAQGAVVVDFEYDAAPDYFLKRAFTARLQPSAEGGFALDVAPILQPSGEAPLEVQPALAATNAAADETRPEATPANGRNDGDPLEEFLRGSQPGVMATTTLTGTLTFTYPPGAASTHACRYCAVDVWDDDSTSGDDYLGTFVAGYDGTFSTSVDNSDAWAGVDPYFKVRLDTSAGIVTNTGGTVYSYTTGVLRTDCPDGTCSLGTVNINDGDTNRARALWIYNALMKGWYLIRNGGPGEDIGQTVVRFPVDGWNGHTADTAHYHPGGDIHLGSNQGVSQSVHLHEQGHYAMYRAYNWNSGNWWFPGWGGCPNHDIPDDSGNETCAWVEGWPTYFQADAFDTQYYTYSSGAFVNLETRTCSWTCTWDSDDTTEGNVAATLHDLEDSANDGTDSGIDYSITNMWTILRRNGGQQWDFHEYFQTWDDLYSATDFRNAASQNTISY